MEKSSLVIITTLPYDFIPSAHTWLVTSFSLGPSMSSTRLHDMSFPGDGSKEVASLKGLGKDKQQTGVKWASGM